MDADTLQLGPVTVHLGRHDAVGPNGTSTLSRTEVALLAFLRDRAGAAVSRDELLREVWGYRGGVASRAVDDAVKRLRAKIEVERDRPRYLVTVHGVGYRLDLDATAPIATPAPDLVGRSAELQHLAHLIDAGARLVTVIGPAGIGKTTVADAFLATRRGARWRVTLDGAIDGEALTHTVAAGLGLEVGRDADAAVARFLARQGKPLIVLDNVEQIAEIAASQLGRWLAAAPGAVFVATSRHRLGVAPEHLLELGPLAEADAADLFARRARRVRSDFDAEAHREAVHAIVRALDGIPLAIELAAARSRLLAPDQLRDRLRERLDVLSTSDRDVPPRQATLDGALSWSWDLLDGDERPALATLSVFRGGFTLAAAEAVLADPDALDLVERLRDRSLVHAFVPADQPLGLRLGIYEPIRRWVECHLGDAERADAEGRHAAWFGRLGAADAVATLRRSGGRDALHRYAVELDNLMVAIERSLEAAPEVAAHAWLAANQVLRRRGPLRRTVALAEAVLAQPLPVSTRLRALNVTAPLLRNVGRDEDGIACAREAVQLARSAGDLRWEAVGLCTLGTLEKGRGRADAARQNYEEALALAEGIDARQEAAAALQRLGSLHHEAGRFDLAEPYHERALAAFRALGDHEHEANTLGNLGNLRKTQGRFDEAERLYRRCLERGRSLGAESTVRQHAMNLANLLADRGELQTAMEAYDEALDAARATGDLWLEGEILTNLGSVQGELGGLDDARATLGDALDLHVTTGNQYFEVLTRVTLGEIEAARGDVPVGRAHVELALQLAEERHLGAAVDARTVLAELHLAAGEHDAARAALDLVFDALGDEAGVRRASALCARADLARRDGRGEDAARDVAEARALAEALRVAPTSVLARRLADLGATPRVPVFGPSSVD